MLSTHWPKPSAPRILHVLRQNYHWRNQMASEFSQDYSIILLLSINFDQRSWSQKRAGSIQNLDDNIDARVFFWPLSDLDFIKSRTYNPVAKSLPSRSVNIPCFHDITQEEQLRIINIIKDTYEASSSTQISWSIEII